MKAFLPSNETARLVALPRDDILDSQVEPAYDDITRLASVVCNTLMALVSLVDEGGH